MVGQSVQTRLIRPAEEVGHLAKYLVFPPSQKGSSLGSLSIRYSTQEDKVYKITRRGCVIFFIMTFLGPRP